MSTVRMNNNITRSKILEITKNNWNVVRSVDINSTGKMCSIPKLIAMSNAEYINNFTLLFEDRFSLLYIPETNWPKIK